MLSLDISPTVTTTYTLTVSNGAGHTTTATVTVDVIPTAAPTSTTTVAPTAASIAMFFSGVPTINEGETTYLWASYSGTSGTVDNGVGALQNTLAIDISPSVTTTYTLTVSNGAGQSVTSMVTVTVIPSSGTTTTTAVPTGTTTSTSSTTVAPQPSSITHFLAGNTVINEGDSTYLWASYSGTSGSVDNGVGNFPNTLAIDISPTVTTTYTLTVSNGAGHTTTATVTITVNPLAGSTTTTTIAPTTTSTTSTTVPVVNSAVSITSQPTSNSVVVGNSHTFSVTATGTGSLSYQWYLDNSAIAGATSQTYVANTEGTYKVQVSNELNGVTETVNSYSVSLTFYGATITNVPADKYVTQGSSKSLFVSVSEIGGVTTTYQWKLNGADISGATSQGYMASLAGDYTLTVTSSRNGVTKVQTTNNIHVYVVASPSISSFDSVVSTIADGNSTVLVPVFADGTGVITPGNISVSSGQNVSVTPASTTTYTLIVTNQAGTSRSLTYQVTVTTAWFEDAVNAASVNRGDGSTSITLNNGKVLTFGDYSAQGTVITDLFNPTDNTFYRTADMNVGRNKASGILLKNGKVLVTGGMKLQVHWESINSAELFDPITNTWSVTGSMNTARRDHFMTVLQDGRVLTGGGYNTSNGALSSVEIYDPATGVFTNVASMPEARSNVYSGLLENGNVLVMGGYNSSSGRLLTATIYNPTTNSWTNVTSTMHYGHADGAVMVQLNDGRFMIAGGIDYGGVANTETDIFDPATNTFSAGPDLNSRRGYFTAHTLLSGKVVFLGGYDGLGHYWDTVEEYDPTTNLMVTQARGMLHPRYGHSSALMLDGRVMIVGSNTSNGIYGEVFNE